MGGVKFGAKAHGSSVREPPLGAPLAIHPSLPCEGSDQMDASSGSRPSLKAWRSLEDSSGDRSWP